jgi:hypothetical protein
MENGQKHLRKIFGPKKWSFILEHPIAMDVSYGYTHSVFAPVREYVGNPMHCTVCNKRHRG